MKLTFQRNTCHNIVCELKLIFTEPENYFLLCLTEKNKLDLILARCQQIDFFVTYRLEFQNFPKFFNFYSKHRNVYQQIFDLYTKNIGKKPSWSLSRSISPRFRIKMGSNKVYFTQVGLKWTFPNKVYGVSYFVNQI